MKFGLLNCLMVLLLCTFGKVLPAQSETKFTLSGYIKSAETGEELINATFFVEELGLGNISNAYGYYSITLPAGNYNVKYSYLGCQDYTFQVDLNGDKRLDVDLKETAAFIEEITVVAKEANQNVSSTEMSKENLKIEAIKKLPALFGEVDIIKAIQMLPGVKSMGEGTSGFYVRGGNADQNLVLLDEAPIYNASHMLGFFSSFNPDAVKDMNLYKGAIPARYGGRLSSVLDIRMKEGNDKKFNGAAGIGTIMSRLAVEAPLGDNGSFIVAGRRSYLDILGKAYFELQNDEEKPDDFTFYFYDLNAKGNYKLGENDRLFVSGYFGRDVMELPEEGFDLNLGNRTTTVRWNHIFSPKLFANISAYYSKYDYALGIKEDLSDVDWKASLDEWSGKADFNYYLSPKHTLRFGAQVIEHDLKPGEVTVLNADTLVGEVDIANAKTLENAIYISDEWEVNDRLKINFGIRGSSLHNLGPMKHPKIDSAYQITDTTFYKKGIYHTYFNLEPRVGVKYSLNDAQSIKASYNRTAQYIQQASNGNTASPFDVWFNATPNVKPQLADQFAVGYFQNFRNNQFEFSAEVYFKRFINAIDFKERADILLNENLEGELRIGKARAYGLELMLRKNVGKFTGFVGYTYSKVEKKIDQINENNWYNAKYDKPHDLTISINYELTKRLSVSTNFVYASGGAVTFPTGKYTFQGTVIPVYSDRNAERLPDYHRMDFGLTWKGKTFKKNNPEQKKRFQSEWVFSIYNVYNRKNAFAINFRQDELTNKTYAEKSAIFSMVPSFTYNVKF